MDGDVRVQWDARGLHLGTQPGSVYGEESRVESFLSGVRAWFFWKASRCVCGCELSSLL